MSTETGVQDFDAICTAIWMMIVYEQQLGDAQFSSYAHHLKGLSSLLRHHCESHPALEQSETSSALMPVVFTRQTQAQSLPGLSIYSARVLIWTALLDAAAAFAGIGGHVNKAILNTVLRCNQSAEGGAKDPVKAFLELHRYSGPLYRLAWGEYPEHELLADVEDRDVYGLLAGCVQLRFMTAQLATEYTRSPAEAAEHAKDVEKAIQGVGATFAELIEVASRLSLATDNQNRLVSNIRAIVPMYHAAVLDFMRLSSTEQGLNGRQRHALKEIMNLAFQSQQHGGDEAVMKLAWPLFIAALETDDMLHRDWILKQFRTISKYGISFQRAHEFLVENLALQLSSAKRICLRTQMEKTARFVLG
ncbi:hypothetical protein FB567DRAFT_586787 [Paraphoma chrysanthemicola]|uniref:Uncharacterized protein n=1 Tax=Paraphoma chrysanthemicola TaxID=798071 RepID=A0A8K0W495_9PLEO|nr:hypothetical protein FB567DRAFT_586787 [Paraphoma chrysanthemicola]